MLSVASAIRKDRNKRLLVIELGESGSWFRDFQAGGSEPKLLGEYEVSITGGSKAGAGSEWGGAIREQLIEKGLRGRECITVLPLSHVLLHSFEAPELPDEDLNAMIALEAEGIFPFQPGELIIASKRQPLEGGGSRVLLAGIQPTRLDAVEAGLKAAGLGNLAIAVAGVDLPIRSIPTLELLVSEEAIALRSTARGVIQGLRLLQSGEVRAMLEDDGCVADIARQLKLASRELRTALGAAPELRVITSPALAEWIRTRLEPALAKVGLAPIMELSTAAETAAVVVEAVSNGGGLALNLKRPKPTHWELIRRAVGGRRAATRAVAVVGVLVFILALTFVWRGWRASALEARWDRMADQVAAVEKLESDIRAWRPWYPTGAPTLDLMKLITEAFPVAGEVYATTLQVRDQREVICSGVARRRDDFVRFQERLGATAGVTGLQVQQLRGDGPVQFSVTFQWTGRVAR